MTLPDGQRPSVQHPDGNWTHIYRYISPRRRGATDLFMHPDVARAPSHMENQVVRRHELTHLADSLGKLPFKRSRHMRIAMQDIGNKTHAHHPGTVRRRELTAILGEMFASHYDSNRAALARF